MVDLDAMDADPWPTWPVDKKELRGLVDDIERLRGALHEWDAIIQHQYSGSREAMSDMTYAAQRTAHLLHGDEPWPQSRIERLEAALRFYACDCKPECKCGLEYYSGVTYCGHTARKTLEGKDD
jgi:hypothetical protein